MQYKFLGTVYISYCKKLISIEHIDFVFDLRIHNKRVRLYYRYLFTDFSEFDAMGLPRAVRLFSSEVQQVPDTDSLVIFKSNVFRELLAIGLNVVGFVRSIY